MIQTVALRAGISPPQATRAVSAMLAFLAARLPSPVMGHIHEAVSQAAADARSPSEGERT